MEELSFGMYVSKLDRPWTETPFVFQGFVLKSEKQIDALKKYCKHVFVDPEKEDPAEMAKASAEEIAKIRGTTVYKEAASVEVELPRAQTAYAKTTVVIKELSRAVEIGNAIDSTRSHEAAAQITNSVVRNPDAMALLIKLQEKSGATLSRAAEVSVMMTIFGRFLQLPQDRLEILGMLGLLQDVGKLKLPTEIATQGPINAAQIELYRTHVDHSVEILGNTPGLPPELPGLASLHHERFDGSGYPRGLRGGGIALFGLIAGIVDTFDTLTAPLPFGENMPPSNALNIISARGSFTGTGRAVHTMRRRFPVGCVVELNARSRVVIAQNLVRRLQPPIMVVKDARDNPLIPYKMLDLMSRRSSHTTLPHPAHVGIRHREDRPARANRERRGPSAPWQRRGFVHVPFPFIEAARRMENGVPMAESGTAARVRRDRHIDAAWGYHGDAVRARLRRRCAPRYCALAISSATWAATTCLRSFPRGWTRVALLAAEKSLRALANPFWIGEDEIYARPSIGIAMYPGHGDQPESLLQQAKSACAVARGEPSHAAVYAEDQENPEASRLLYENRLRTAVSDDALELVFQPQYDLRLGQIMGAESLLRRRDQAHGLIPAEDAFAAAESAGRVTDLLSSTLNRALRNCSEFRYNAGLDLRIGVNLPGRALLHELRCCRARWAPGLRPQADHRGRRDCGAGRGAGGAGNASAAERTRGDSVHR